MPFAVATNQSTGFGISLDAMSPSGASAYAALVLTTPGLQHYYKCDDYSGTTLTDSKGSETLTITGTNSLSTLGAIAGSPATAFDTTGGTTGTAYTTSHTQIGGAADYSMEGWVKTTDSGSNKFYFGEGYLSSTNPTNYLGATSGVPRLFMRNNAGIGDAAGSGASLADGQWHYYCVVGDRTANTINCYVDNLGSRASMTYPATPYTVNNFAISSMYRTTNGFYTKIVVAHVATYNVKLSLAQMQQHYTAGVAAKLAFLRFF